MENLKQKRINLLRSNARSVVRELGLLNDAYFEIGVTLAERHLLIELAACSCPTMGEIAKRLLLDKSTASRLIARAMKKGFIKCGADKNDKRKRFLYLTAHGRKTLETFEPIAFKQTEQALLALQPEEAELVHQGIALYAKGLRLARLKHLPLVEEQQNGEGAEFLELKDKGYELSLFKQEDEGPLYKIFRTVVETGAQFPYECSSMQEFQRQFFAPGSSVYVCRSLEGEVVGGFYLRANYGGRSGHIANAAYMIKESHRGQGIGTLLINVSCKIAKGLGFRAMQFNMVLSQNKGALKLYQKLGFKIVGTIPDGVRNPDGSTQDGYILFRRLE